MEFGSTGKPFMKLMILITLSLLCVSAFAGSKVAVVKLVRGEADVLTLGKTTRLKVDDWVENGAVVKTAEKSFVKLIFVDKSSMNVGPNSEMKIESFSGKDSGVIDLVKGKIRSQVTKDYLQINKDKSKLFIKTQNAVMGVRGTDFMISTNGVNTSTVLFEGEIVFNKLDNRSETSSSRLEEIVDRGVRMHPGEFSVMEASRPQPTVPSLLNIQQREKLEKNVEFDSTRTPSNEDKEAKSVVPAGLSGQQVSNNVEALKTEVAQVVATEPAAQGTPSSADPNGYVQGDAVKPANGSFVHIDSGVIIAPGPGSVLDANTNTYIPGQDGGRVSDSGDFIPPKNVEITADGKIMVTTTNANGETVVKEVPKAAPVAQTVASTTPGAAVPGAASTTAVVPKNDILRTTAGSATMPTQMNPPKLDGGIQGVNDPTRASLPYTDTTIIIKPTSP